MDLPGLMTLRECELLEMAGLAAPEVVTAATYNGARALHLEGEIGSVQPGRRADLLVLSGDPTVNLQNLRRVERIMLDGRWVDRDKLVLK
jgi:imidazolonepropionase-like amidohydrolase